tara:strand:- start:626339 stop:626608 length:270 start_codon:yes stop_codon:yes gene_type:complete
LVIRLGGTQWIADCGSRKFAAHPEVAWPRRLNVTFWCGDPSLPMEVYGKEVKLLPVVNCVPQWPGFNPGFDWCPSSIGYGVPDAMWVPL